MPQLNSNADVSAEPYSVTPMLHESSDDDIKYCRGTSKCLQAGVWRSLSWCLESVMPWRGIVGFTKFSDKRVNDLDLVRGYVVGVACLHQ